MRFVLLTMLLAGCAAGRAKFHAPDEDTSRRYAEARLWKTHFGWNARLLGPSGGSIINPIGALFSDRLFIDIPLPEKLYEGLEIDLATFGHEIEAGTRVTFGSDRARRYPEGKVVVTSWDAGLKRVRGTFVATSEGHRIEGWFTALDEG